MRDRLGKNRFWNIPPANFTQTDAARFLKGPFTPLTSGFTKSADEWNAFKKNWEDKFKLPEI